jgi:hypothetical protein
MEEEGFGWNGEWYAREEVTTAFLGGHEALIVPPGATPC